MEFEKLIYPGFNKTFGELECFTLNKSNQLEIIDYFNIDWVRSAVEELVKSVDEKIKIEFIEPTTVDIESASKLVKADLSVEDAKKDFSKVRELLVSLPEKVVLENQLFHLYLEWLLQNKEKKLEFLMLISGDIQYQKC